MGFKQETQSLTFAPGYPVFVLRAGDQSMLRGGSRQCVKAWGSVSSQVTSPGEAVPPSLCFPIPKVGIKWGKPVSKIQGDIREGTWELY